MKAILFAFVLLSLVLTSCEKGDDAEANELSKKILVEGYVFANEPVKIKIASVDLNGSSTSHSASGAYVVINQGGLELELIENDSIPGLYIQQDQTSALGDTGAVSLNIVYGGHAHSAQTIFPTKLTGLEISNSEIFIQPGNSSDVVATLSWNPVSDAIGYCFLARNTVPYASPILNGNSTDTSPFSRIHYTTSVDLKANDFSFLGTYQIYVTAIGPELKLLYNNYSGDNLMAAPSNIGDGWGVFTAFNGQAVSVTIQ